MGYIPKGAKWYLAELVVEFLIDGEPKNVVHINWLLVRADSPEEAYERSLSLGAQYDNSYLNTDAKVVTARFRGLRDLNVIHGELEHGAELIYQKKTGLSAEDLEKLVAKKEELGVFAPAEADED